MSSRAIGLIAACAAFAGGHTAHAAPTAAARKPIPPRVVTSHYYGPSASGYPGLTWNNPDGPLAALGDGGLGAVLFYIRSTDVNVALLPADASTQPAGGTAYFYDKADRPLTQPSPFCGRGSFRVPPKAASLRVSMDPTACPGIVTEGSVTATIAQRQPRNR
jgi:hypothetical protein